MKDFFRKPIFSYGIFWSWNLIFALLLIYSEVQERFLFSIIKNALTGFTPLDFSLYSLLIFAIPIGSIVLGLTKLKKKPHQLLKLFYGVEIPLSLVFILRLSIFRELTFATTHLLILLVAGMISFFIDIILEESVKPRWLVYAQKVGHSCLLIIGAYISIVLIFYTFPILWLMLSNIGEFDIFDIFRAGFFILLFAVFALYCATLFAILPIAIIILYFKAFIRNYSISIPYGKLIMYFSIVVNCVLLFGLSNSQPQEYALETLSQDFSIAENKLEFINHSQEIKEGLLNGYLNSYRYISSSENSHVLEMYKQSFGINNAVAQSVQDAYNFFMSPFLYKGSMYADREECKKLYEKYFDANIQKAESETILNSMKATWDSDGIEAGLLNVNQEKVHIERQEITVHEKDGIAEVEIYESFKNKTFTQQEIFYFFALPPNSVITGLWLSDTVDSPKKYSFNVSPRGAAQKVYKAEVRRRIDPSLLEQVGPNQYRLRAFPIASKTRVYNEGRRRNGYTVTEGNVFHLWLSYKTIAKDSAGWQLPQLLEKRNAYWSGKTELLVNGVAQTKADCWLPTHVESVDSVTFTSGASKISDSLYIKIESGQTLTIADFTNKKIAVLIDGSFSMNSRRDVIITLLDSLMQKGFSASNTTFYMSGEEIKKYDRDQLINKLKTDGALFFETTTFMDMASKFSTMDTSQFDAILMVSDIGNYESSVDSLLPISFRSPLYMMHLAGEQAPIYNDAFLETMKSSKGTVVRGIREFAENLTLATSENRNLIAYTDGVRYSLVDSLTDNDEAEISQLAANVYIQNIVVPKDSTRNQFLDAIHAIALAEMIVTPYSSMIVLVNERQKKLLEEAESATDRFDRKVESGDESTSKPSDPFHVSGTPEPHEWLLIGLVFGFALYLQSKKRAKLKQ